MNNSHHLKKMPIQWTDLLRAFEGADIVRNYVLGVIGHINPPIPSGTYNQSSISEIVDECRGIKTMGQCYTKQTFEAKIIH